MFDIAGARSAGYSDDDILTEIQKDDPSFDVAGARTAGYSLDEIAAEIYKPRAAPEPRPQLTVTPVDRPPLPGDKPVSIPSANVSGSPIAVGPAPVATPAASDATGTPTLPPPDATIGMPTPGAEVPAQKIRPVQTLVEGTKDVVKSMVNLGAAYTDIEKKSLDDRITAWKRYAEGYDLDSDTKRDYTPDQQQKRMKVAWANIERLSGEKLMVNKLHEGVHHALNSAALQPDKNWTKLEGVRGYVQDVIRTAPQIASQVAASAAGGPGVSLVFMGGQIGGSSYQDMVSKGVEPGRALAASLANGAMQAPLEQIGLTKALKTWNPATYGGKWLKEATESGATEFLTEALQNYPDAAADIWATTPGQNEQQRAREFVRRFWEVTKDGLYQGLVAAPLGASTSVAGAVGERVLFGAGKESPNQQTPAAEPEGGVKPQAPAALPTAPSWKKPSEAPAPAPQPVASPLEVLRSMGQDDRTQVVQAKVAGSYEPTKTSPTDLLGYATQQMGVGSVAEFAALPEDQQAQRFAILDQQVGSGTAEAPKAAEAILVLTAELDKILPPVVDGREVVFRVSPNKEKTGRGVVVGTSTTGESLVVRKVNRDGSTEDRTVPLAQVSAIEGLAEVPKLVAPARRTETARQAPAASTPTQTPPPAQTPAAAPAAAVQQPAKQAPVQKAPEPLVDQPVAVPQNPKPRKGEQPAWQSQPWYTGQNRPLQADPNSTLNEYRFRLAHPDVFTDGTVSKPRFAGMQGPGVRFVVGKVNGRETVQSVVFDKGKVSWADAQQWLAANAVKLGRPSLAQQTTAKVAPKVQKPAAAKETPRGQSQPQSVPAPAVQHTDALVDALAARSGVTLDRGGVQEVATPAAHQPLFDLIEAVTGFSVHTVRVSPEVQKALGSGFDGVTYSGHIYVDENSHAPVWHVAMHEATHAIMRDQKLRGELIEFTWQNMTEEGRAAAGERAKLEGRDSAYGLEEVIADFAADQSTKAGYWQRMMDYSPSLTKKLVAEIYKFLNRITRAFTAKYGTTKETWFKDVEAQRDAMAKLLANAMKAKSTEKVMEPMFLYAGQRATGFAEAQRKFSSTLDRKERFEISDKAAQVVNHPQIVANATKDMHRIERSGALKTQEGVQKYSDILTKRFEQKTNISKGLNLSDVLVHPDLYKQYPSLADRKVYFRKGRGSAYGYVDKFGNITINTGRTKGAQQLKDTLLHEVQHQIQAVEGFSGGGSAAEVERVLRTTPSVDPSYGDAVREYDDMVVEAARRRAGTPTDGKYSGYSDLELSAKLFNAKFALVNRPHELYQNLAGEIEARDASLRQDMTDGQRAAAQPLSAAMMKGYTERKDIVVRKGPYDLGAAIARASEYAVAEESVKDADASDLTAPQLNKVRMGDLPTIQFSRKKQRWGVDYSQTAWGKVNKMLSQELDYVETLLGPVAKTYEGPSAKGPVRAAEPTVLMDKLLASKERIAELGDRSIPVMKLVAKYKPENPLKFAAAVKHLRDHKVFGGGAAILGTNDKAFMALDGGLLTCHPSAQCQECYAAGAYGLRRGTVNKLVRNTMALMANPKEFGRLAAAEVVKKDHTEMPYLRIHGAGDLTTTEQVAAYNEMIRNLDRPVQIFSRHHDMMGKLRGTQAAPLVRMGSVDAHLFKQYGIDYLAKNMSERGIANAWLYTDPSELPMIKQLMDRNAVGLILCANHKLYETMPEEYAGTNCPCDAGERGTTASCRRCAYSMLGCFMPFSPLSIDADGKLWRTDDPKAPKNIVPVLDWTTKGVDPTRGYREVAATIMDKDAVKIQIQIGSNRVAVSKGEKPKPIKIRDNLNHETLAVVKTENQARDWQKTLRDAAKKIRAGERHGTLAGGDIQPEVKFSRRQTQTPEFKAWFGDWEGDPANASKVVDKNGQPLVVYHGSEKSGFTEFDKDRGGENTGRKLSGFYFTDSPLGAQTYSGTKKEAVLGSEELSPGNYPTYLSMRNPYVVDFGGRDWSGGGPDGDVDPLLHMDRVVREAQEMGFDGVVAKNVSDEGRYGHGYNWGENTYVVFSPTQIKSATGNSGAFSPTNPDIRFSRRTEDALSIDLRDAFDAYDNGTTGMSESDMADEVSRIAEERGDPVLEEMAFEYRQAVREDATEYGMRSGEPERIAEQMISEARKRLGAEQPMTAAAHHAASARLFDVSAIKSAETESELYSVGGRMMAKAKTQEEMNAVQAAMKKRRDELVVRLARKPVWAPNGLLSEGTMDMLRRKLQDRFDPLLRYQTVLGVNTPAEDAYLKQEVIQGKTQDRLEELESRFIKPLQDAIGAAKVDVADLESYLYALHAPERNAYIAEINPAIPVAGSGMFGNATEKAIAVKQNPSDQRFAKMRVAEEIIDSVRKRGLQPTYDKLAKMVAAINDMAVAVREQAGLLTPEEAEAWQRYEHYVPLKGTEDEDANLQQRARVGRRFSIGGKEAKRALGRQSEASHILANTVLSAEGAIIRAEKNKVSQAFLEFVQAHPDPNLWELDIAKPERYFDERSGEVRVRHSSRFTVADAQRYGYPMSVKVNGLEHQILIKDPALANAMTNVMGADNLGRVLGVFSAYARYFSMINTSYVPEFVVSNLARDLQTAGINLTGDVGMKEAAAIIGDVPRAVHAGFRGLGKNQDTDAWRMWWDEFSAAGGRIAFLNMNDLDAVQKRLMREIQSAGSPGAMLRTRNGIAAVGGFIDRLNGSVENALRLSTYVHLRKLGVDKDKAASAAKNITVNFNRKGEWGSTLNALYVFSNASIQGTARLMKAVGRSRKVQAMVAAIAAASFATAMMNRAVGGKDDDDEDSYDKVPSWVKQNNMVFMRPDGKGYWTIPIPYGYNVFWAAGQGLDQAISGKDPLQGAATVVGAVANSFNPLGSAPSLVQMFTPTALRWIVDLTLNRNFMGRPISLEQAHSPEKAGGYAGRMHTSEWAKTTGKAATDLTGGSMYIPGGADKALQAIFPKINSPEFLDYMVEVMTGGVGRTVSNVMSTAQNIIEGKDVVKRQLPFVRRVTSDLDRQQDVAKFYETADQLEHIAKNYTDLAQTDREAAQKFRDRYANQLQLAYAPKGKQSTVDEFRKRVRDLRKRRDAAEAKDRTAEVERIDEQILAVVWQFDRLYTQRTGEQP